MPQSKKPAKKTAKKAPTNGNNKMTIDVGFLKQPPWSKVNLSIDDMLKILNEVWSQECVLRQELKKNDPKTFEQKVLSTFEGRMRRKLASTAQEGNDECFILGMSFPYDSFGAMRGRCMKEYNKDRTGSIGKFVKVIRVDSRGKETKDKSGKRKVVPIFYPVHAKDNRKRIGTEIKGTAWQTTIVGLWGPTGKKIQKPFVTLAGGQFGDKHISLACPSCGREDVSEICSKCGIEKPYILPKIMQNMFSPCSFDMRVKANDDGTESIAWTKQTMPKISNNKQSTNILKLLSGHKTLKAHRITTKTLLRTYKQYKNNPNWWVWISCAVNRIIPTENSKGERKFIIGDEHLDLMDSQGRVVEGITVRLPPHVWEYQVEGKIGEGSSVVITGKIDGFTGNDKRLITYIQAYGVWGVPGLVNRPPKADTDIEEEVGMEISGDADEILEGLEGDTEDLEEEYEDDDVEDGYIEEDEEDEVTEEDASTEADSEEEDDEILEEAWEDEE